MKVRMLSIEEIEAIGRAAEKAGNEPVFQMANELLSIRSRVRGGEIVAESLISARDGRGRVRVTWHDEDAFLDVDIATALGQSIIEAACAARIDAAFAAVAERELGLSGATVAHVLRAVRGARRVDDSGTPH